MSIFQNLISSIKGGALGSRYFRTKDLDNLPQDINEAVESVMSKSGEVSALVYAENLFNLIEELNDKQFISFFNTLSEKYDIDSDSLSAASIEYSKNKTQENLEKIAQLPGKSREKSKKKSSSCSAWTQRGRNVAVKTLENLVKVKKK